MKQTLLAFFAAALLCGATTASPAHASEAPASAPAPAADAHAQLLARLREVAQPLALANGRLDGPGAAWIARESEQAQFVLVGEDHGMADIPQFATALWNAAGAHPFDQLVVEAGPYASTVMSDLRDDKGLAALNARYPTAIPFFNWREDGAMVANALRDGNGALCGIDQEFVLSGRLLFRRLADMTRNADARALAIAYAERDEALYRDMVAKRNPELSLFSQLEAADFARLKQAFVHDADALAMLADIETSVEIYRLQQTDSFRSNAMRSALMKRNLMRCLRADATKTTPPRALFRMGAFHVGRGLSPTGLFDVGNLASELAQSNGMRSLHLLVVAADGEANRWFPFADEDAAKHAPYHGNDELDVVGALPLLEVADHEHWTLIPLASLRSTSAAPLRRAGGERFETLVNAYDAVVVIPRARAATLYGDSTR